MPVNTVLSRQLKESLGPDTGEGLVTWMEHADTLHDDLSIVRGELQDTRRDLKSEMQDFRREMQDFRREMRRDLKAMRLSLEARMDIAFANTEATFERRFSDVIKWSFVFWCGAVAAIAALAGVLK